MKLVVHLSSVLYFCKMSMYRAKSMIGKQDSG